MQPVEAVAPGRERDHDDCRRRKAGVTRHAPGGPRPIARSAKKTSGIHLINTANAHAAPAKPRRPPAASTSAERECHQERVVVATAGEMDREQRIPAHERRGIRPVSRQPGREHHAGEHPSAANTLKIHAAAAADEPDTSATTSVSRVKAVRTPTSSAPGGARVVVGGVVRELARRVHVGIGVVDGRDPAVLPVRPGVGREQQRPGEREELDHERRDERRPKSRGSAPQEEQTAEITGERRDEQRKEQSAERRRRRGPRRPGRSEPARPRQWRRTPRREARSHRPRRGATRPGRDRSARLLGLGGVGRRRGRRRRQAAGLTRAERAASCPSSPAARGRRRRLLGARRCRLLGRGVAQRSSDPGSSRTSARTGRARSPSTPARASARGTRRARAGRSPSP